MVTTVVTAPSATGGAKYSVGTLQYTKAGLFTVFAWLLWGDFCFQMMEKVMPLIYPLFLVNELGASNTTVTILMQTIPQGLTAVLCPAISFRSDRTRTRWGRRIPYMTFTAPFLCLFLVGLGYSKQIAAWLQMSNYPELLHIAPYAAIITIIGFLVIGFTFFNDFVGSVYWYLFADVVPHQFLGRFLGLFRLVAIGADVLFQRYVLRYAESHMEWIFLGAAALYFVGFGLMCWRVKEGQYPPVTDLSARPSILEQIKVYFRQCFTCWIYVLLFCHSTASVMARSVAVVQLVFLQNLPGTDLAKIGIVTGWISVAGMVLAYPSGWLADRFHPLRISLLMGILLVPAQIVKFFFMQDYDSFVMLQWATSIPLILFDAVTLPLYISIFPSDKYGQFSSANAMLRSGVVMVGGVLAGVFLDYMTDFGQNKDAYRWMYVWTGAWYAVMVACLIGVYIHWQRHGGLKNYVPPGSAGNQPAEGESPAPAPGH